MKNNHLKLIKTKQGWMLFRVSRSKELIPVQAVDVPATSGIHEAYNVVLGKYPDIRLELKNVCHF